MSRAFRVAVTDGIITRSPCREVKLPRIETPERRFLSPGEVEELADTPTATPRVEKMSTTATMVVKNRRRSEVTLLNPTRFLGDTAAVSPRRASGNPGVGQVPADGRCVCLPHWSPDVERAERPMTTVQRVLPEVVQPRARVERDPEATAEFQRIAAQVSTMADSKHPALTSLFASRHFGLSDADLEEMGLPPAPEL